MNPVNKNLVYILLFQGLYALKAAAKRLVYTPSISETDAPIQMGGWERYIALLFQGLIHHLTLCTVRILWYIALLFQGLIHPTQAYSVP